LTLSANGHFSEFSVRLSSCEFWLALSDCSTFSTNMTEFKLSGVFSFTMMDFSTNDHAFVSVAEIVSVCTLHDPLTCPEWESHPPKTLVASGERKESKN